MTKLPSLWFSNAGFKWSEAAVDTILTKNEVKQLYTTNNDEMSDEFDVAESTEAVTLMVNAEDKYGYINCMAGETATDMAVVSDVTVPEGALLWVAEGAVLTIAEAVTLTIEGKLENYGKIIVNGTLNDNGNLVNNGEIQGLSE